MERKRHHRCGVCGERDAVIFVKIFVEGALEEKGLCAGCALKYLENKESVQKLTFVDDKLIHVIEEMRDLLAGIVTNISAITKVMHKSAPQGTQCSNCGTRYENFQETGYLGCPYCYSAFRGQLSDLFLEVERGLTHKGRVPVRYQRILELKQQIVSLKTELEACVKSENYEKAHRIQKKLQKLIGNCGLGRMDEFN